MIYYIHKVKKDLGWEGFADKPEQTKGNIFNKLRSSFLCSFLSAYKLYIIIIQTIIQST